MPAAPSGKAEGRRRYIERQYNGQPHARDLPAASLHSAKNIFDCWQPEAENKPQDPDEVMEKRFCEWYFIDDTN